MIIIVDAYNVLKQALSKPQVSSSEKNRFIKQINSYAKHKGHKIIIVFDGGSFEWPDKESMNNIIVIHSGIHQTADDWIKEYLNKYKSLDILLISTDRELGRYAAKLNIQSLDALDFYGMLIPVVLSASAQLVNNYKLTKLTQTSTDDLDELIEAESKRIPTKSEDILNHNRLSKAHTLSKKERVLQRKLKKL